MKKLLVALAVVLLLPGSVNALDTRDLVALTAMPLAVAAVSELSGVPTSDLVDVVVAMNRAAAPPPQFVEVVRYVPVALVDQRVEPRFTTYVTTEYDRGLRGDEFAYALGDRIRTYGVREINVVEPPTMLVVEQRQYVAPVVMSYIEPLDPLALVAMPLAVAAVSELAGIPRDDLFSLVSTLNRAYVPPAQFVEIVRYSPVVLVDPVYQPQFTRFVTAEYDRGLYGREYATVVANQLRTYGVDGINIESPQLVVRRDAIVPTVVTRQVDYRRNHPHGGPPGQLKRDLGLQTGAEVVHGEHPARRVTGSVDRSRSRPVAVERRDTRAPETRTKGNQNRRTETERTTGSESRRTDTPAAARPGQGRGNASSSADRPAAPPASASRPDNRGRGKGAAAGAGAGNAAPASPPGGGGQGGSKGNQGQGKGKGKG
jgi:hypothetical protein